uniref:Cystatin domain-containing protein n=1 Tax=Rhabditophanes sp. KR3021 TaxID=114890 RepID=A0AC35UBL6_9BILA
MKILAILLIFSFFFIKYVASYSSLVGGKTNRDPNDPEIVALARKVTIKYNQQSNDLYLYTFSHIQSATSQVVSGVLYELDVLAVKTDCIKNNADLGKETNCPASANGGRVLIKATVYSVPWEDSEEITIQSSTNV